MTRRVPAPLLVAAVVSVQLGGALAATLVRLVGVFGSVTLQLTIAATVMLVTVRPRLRGLNDRGLAGPRRSAHQSHSPRSCRHAQPQDPRTLISSSRAPANAADGDETRVTPTRMITALPAQLKRSLAWDQGKEMSQHAQFSVDTALDVFFCDPHSPWQRGTNENTNGLLRHRFRPGPAFAAVVG